MMTTERPDNEKQDDKRKNTLATVLPIYVTCAFGIIALGYVVLGFAGAVLGFGIAVLAGVPLLYIERK